MDTETTDNTVITEGNNALGVELSNKDLLAIKKLYQVRWTAEIVNWKEKGCDGCMWKVTCPDKNNKLVVQYGQVLSDTIEELLKQVKER